MDLYYKKYLKYKNKYLDLKKYLKGGSYRDLELKDGKIFTYDMNDSFKPKEITKENVNNIKIGSVEYSPLLFAINNNEIDIIDKLIDMDANVREKTNYDGNIINKIFLSLNGVSCICLKSILNCCIHFQPIIIKLLNKGADIHQKLNDYNDETAFKSLIEQNRYDIIDFIISNLDKLSPEYKKNTNNGIIDNTEMLKKKYKDFTENKFSIKINKNNIEELEKILKNINKLKKIN